MDEVRKMRKYDTDTFGSWNLGQTTVSKDIPFEKVIKKAKELNACLIVKPKTGKYYYLKGINGKKTYKEIKNHLIENIANNYKRKTSSYLFVFN